MTAWIEKQEVFIPTGSRDGLKRQEVTLLLKAGSSTNIILVGQQIYSDANPRREVCGGIHGFHIFTHIAWQTDVSKMPSRNQRQR
jgi:hypothetical protein